MSGLRVQTTLHYSHVSFFLVIAIFLLLCHNYIINVFVTTTHLALFFGMLRIKVTLQYVISWFVILRYFALCDNYIFPGSYETYS